MIPSDRRYDRAAENPNRGGSPDLGGRQWRGYNREDADRPWVGGYRSGYQGGMGGIRTSPPGRRYGEGYGGEDYWWMANRGRNRARASARYDQLYREFDRRHQPGFSPVGGMNMGMGGEYRYSGPPRPLGYDQWFSDWTRWF
jgi:hypothetical protein